MMSWKIVFEKYYFFFFCSMVIIIGIISQKVLFSDSLFYTNLEEQLAYDKIETILIQQDKLSWTGYLLITISTS